EQYRNGKQDKAERRGLEAERGAVVFAIGCHRESPPAGLRTRGSRVTDTPVRAAPEYRADSPSPRTAPPAARRIPGDGPLDRRPGRPPHATGHSRPAARR